MHRSHMQHVLNFTEMPSSKVVEHKHLFRSAAKQMILLMPMEPEEFIYLRNAWPHRHFHSGEFEFFIHTSAGYQPDFSTRGLAG